MTDKLPEEQIRAGLDERGGLIGKSIDELQEENIRDSLTGLYNKNYLLAKLKDLTNEKGGRPFVVILFDCDKFKNINDTLGHQVGDEVMASLGKTINNGIRGESFGDFAARYGGDEVAVVMAVDDIDLAIERAELIRKQIEQKRIRTTKGEVVTTISGGVVLWDGKASAEELMESADWTMYVSKHAGGNKISAYGKEKK